MILDDDKKSTKNPQIDNQSRRNLNLMQEKSAELFRKDPYSEENYIRKFTIG